MSPGPEPRRKDGQDRTGAAAPGRALVRIEATPTKARAGGRLLHRALWMTGLVVALALGAVGLDAARSSRTDGEKQQADATTQVLHRLGDEMARLKGSVDTLRTAADARQDDSLRGLKKSVDSLKQEIEQVRAADGGTFAQLSAKIDRADHDPSQKLSDIMARLDKLDREPLQKGAEPGGQKLADLNGRLDRLERQVSAAMPTGSIPQARPQTAAVSLPVPAAAAVVAAKPSRQEAVPNPAPKASNKPEAATTQMAETRPLPAKPATVGGWVVRDVYDGMALVEARRGDLREISPGEYLPGAGEVRSIERRGRSWVVLTSQGVIENGTF